MLFTSGLRPVIPWCNNARSLPPYCLSHKRFISQPVSKAGHITVQSNPVANLQPVSPATPLNQARAPVPEGKGCPVVLAMSSGALAAIFFACYSFSSPNGPPLNTPAKSSPTATEAQRKQGRLTKNKSDTSVQGNKLPGLVGGVESQRSRSIDQLAAAMVAGGNTEFKPLAASASAIASLFFSVGLGIILVTSLHRSNIKAAAPYGNSDGSGNSTKAEDLPSLTQALRAATVRNEELLNLLGSNASSPNTATPNIDFVPAQGRTVGAGQILKGSKPLAPGVQMRGVAWGVRTGAGKQIPAGLAAGLEVEDTVESSWSTAGGAEAYGKASQEAGGSQHVRVAQGSRWASKSRLRGSGYVLPDDAQKLMPVLCSDGSLVFTREQLTAAPSWKNVVEESRMSLAEEIRHWCLMLQHGSQQEAADTIKATQDLARDVLRVVQDEDGGFSSVSTVDGNHTLTLTASSNAAVSTSSDRGRTMGFADFNSTTASSSGSNAQGDAQQPSSSNRVIVRGNGSEQYQAEPQAYSKNPAEHSQVPIVTQPGSVYRHAQQVPPTPDWPGRKYSGIAQLVEFLLSVPGQVEARIEQLHPPEQMSTSTTLVQPAASDILAANALTNTPTAEIQREPGMSSAAQIGASSAAAWAAMARGAKNREAASFRASSALASPEKPAAIALRVQAAADAVKMEGLLTWICTAARQREAAWQRQVQLQAAAIEKEAAVAAAAAQVAALKTEAEKQAGLARERAAAAVTQAAQQEQWAAAAAAEEKQQALAREALLQRQLQFRGQLEREWNERRAAWTEREALAKEQQRQQAVLDKERCREAIAIAEVRAAQRKTQEAAKTAAAEKRAMEDAQWAAMQQALLEEQQARAAVAQRKAELEADMARQAVAAQQAVLTAQARAAEKAEAEMQAAAEKAAAAVRRALEEEEAAAAAQLATAAAQANAAAARQAAEQECTAARKAVAEEAAMYARQVATAAAMHAALAQQAVFSAQSQAASAKQSLLARRDAALARLAKKEQLQQQAAHAQQQQQAAHTRQQGWQQHQLAYWSAPRLRASISKYDPLQQLVKGESVGQWQEIAHKVFALEAVVGTELPRYSPLQVMVSAHPGRFASAFRDFECLQAQPLRLAKVHPAIAAWVKAAQEAAVQQRHSSIPAWKQQPVWTELQGPHHQKTLAAALETWPAFASELEHRHKTLHSLACKGTEAMYDDEGSRIRGLAMVATLAAWNAIELSKGMLASSRAAAVSTTPQANAAEAELVQKAPVPV